jgi:hypothetical protein
MKTHKLTAIDKLEPDDCHKRKTLCETLLAEMDSDETIGQGLVFSDEETFHTSVKVNRHDHRVWGTENHATLGLRNDSSKAKVCRARSCSQVQGPFFVLCPDYCQCD